jgi:hypothetical protein
LQGCKRRFGQRKNKAVVDDGKITEKPETKSGGDQLAQSRLDIGWFQKSWVGTVGEESR